MSNSEVTAQSKGDAAAIALVQKLVDVGINGVGPFDSAAKVADQALAAANGNVDKAVDIVSGQHRKLVASEGFITGLGGFVTLPVALPANIFSFYALATRNVAAIAKLRGFDISQPEVRTDVLMTLMGTDAKGIMAKAGVVSTGGRVVGLASNHLPPAAMMLVNKGLGMHLLAQIGQKGFARILGRSLPVVGGVVGAGADWWLLRQVDDAAKKEFRR